MAERTALINHLRALLLERGIVVAQGRRKLEDALSVFADEDEPRRSSILLMLPPLWRGGKDPTVPDPAGGATPITPKTGRREGTSCPQGSR